MSILCKIGLHEKHEIEKGFLNTGRYIAEVMERYMPKYFNSGNKETYFGIITSALYDIRRCLPLPKIRNQVCLKCGKCFNKVEKEKRRIESAVVYEVQKIISENLKDKIANDLWNENCEGNRNEGN